MKAWSSRTAVAFGAGIAAFVLAGVASAQTVVVQPAAAPPPPASPVVVAPAPPAPSPVVVSTGDPPIAEQMVHPYTRPNRTLLMTGLVVFGAPYVASIGIAATSSHGGDGNLWVPAVGPWLDFGARGGCPAGGDCGAETGNKVLLVIDGILQTVGLLQVAGAFVFPETYGTATVASRGSRTAIHFTPAKLAGDAYGVSAVGEF
jgi:hypothetical protein